MKNKQIIELIFRMQVWAYMDVVLYSLGYIETTWIAKRDLRTSQLR
jgi:hypothetical protein